MYPLAALVFFASIAAQLLKIVGLTIMPLHTGENVSNVAEIA
jgi:hypothetical protein